MELARQSVNKEDILANTCQEEGVRPPAGKTRCCRRPPAFTRLTYSSEVKCEWGALQYLAEFVGFVALCFLKANSLATCTNLQLFRIAQKRRHSGAILLPKIGYEVNNINL